MNGPDSDGPDLHGPDLYGAVFFGLGANLGDREATLRWALRRLEGLVGRLEVASLYRSAPVTASPSSRRPQPDYFNTVALANLGRSIDSRSLLYELKELERLAGRRGAARDAPRPLDIDILAAGELLVELPELPSPAAERWPGAIRIPHARLRHRLFVLEPLAELAPDLRLPPDGRTARSLLAALGAGGSGAEQAVERIGWSDPL